MFSVATVSAHLQNACNYCVYSWHILLYIKVVGIIVASWLVLLPKSLVAVDILFDSGADICLFHTTDVNNLARINCGENILPVNSLAVWTATHTDLGNFLCGHSLLGCGQSVHLTHAHT